MANEGGVWRTVAGRRIFIADGESLVDAMSKSGKFGDKKWDFRGIDEAVSKVEKAVDEANTHKKAVAARIAIDGQESVVNKYLKEIQDGAEVGDERALISYRRRLRLAKRKLLSKEAF